MAFVCHGNMAEAHAASVDAVKIEYRLSFHFGGKPATGEQRETVAAAGVSLAFRHSSLTSPGDGSAEVKSGLVVSDSKIISWSGDTRYYMEFESSPQPWVERWQYHSAPWAVLPTLTSWLRARPDFAESIGSDGGRTLKSVEAGQELSFDASGDLRRWMSTGKGSSGVYFDTRYEGYSQSPSGRWPQTVVTLLPFPRAGQEAQIREIRRERQSVTIDRAEVDRSLLFDAASSHLRRLDPATDKVYEPDGTFLFVRGQEEARIVAAYEGSNWARRGVLAGVGLLGCAAIGAIVVRMRKAR